MREIMGHTEMNDDTSVNSLQYLQLCCRQGLGAGGGARCIVRNTGEMSPFPFCLWGSEWGHESQSPCEELQLVCHDEGSYDQT